MHTRNPQQCHRPIADVALGFEELEAPKRWAAGMIGAGLQGDVFFKYGEADRRLAVAAKSPRHTGTSSDTV